MRTARTPLDQAIVAIVARVEVEDYVAKAVRMAAAGALSCQKEWSPWSNFLPARL